jgi:hypothetical protein
MSVYRVSDERLDVVPKKHPTRRSREERDYLFLYHLSVERRFQGAEDTSARHVAKWAVEILALIDSLAEADDCVGVYLNVREDNIPARRRYEEAGYAADGSYVQSRTGRRMLRMRKVF